MNIDIEVSLKIRANEDTPEVEPRRPMLTCLVDKIAAHPYVVMILREIMRHS